MAYWIFSLFGVSDITTAVVATVAILIVLIWLLFLASALFFDKIFARLAWENLFFFIVGFPTHMYIFYGSLLFLVCLESGKDFYFMYTFFDLDGLFLYILSVFWVAYLIHFIRRCRQVRKEKTAVSIENN